MIYKRMRLVAMLIVMCMLITLLPAGKAERYEASEKVGAELLELLDITYEDLASSNFVDDGETYPCIIWIQEVEIEEAVKAGIDAAEKTKEGYSVWSRYDYPYTTYEADGLTYVEVNLDEESDDEYVQTYIEAEREAAAELYSANNSSFVAENFMARDMSVTYVSRYSPCIFADLSISKIAELIQQEEVVSIELCEEEELKLEDTTSELESSETSNYEITEYCIREVMQIIDVDEAVNRYGVTGSGVKIGQIELECPDEASVIKNPSYNNTQIEGEESTHADNVHRIMSTVAPEATYYASGAYSSNTATVQGSFYERVEWLLSQGVNIINYSAGANVYNQYTARARWVDHIAYNHDVHFVMSSGNEAEQGVCSPGMAYNIITVGATNDISPYNIIYVSPTKGSGFVKNSYVSRPNQITYKPDVVAPGNFGAVWGTSYSAPLVTGAVALICDYRPALKTRQHAVKAILAASTSMDNGCYVNTDEEFQQYGAGRIDVRAALYVVNKGNYSASTGTLTNYGEEKSYTMTVTTSDTKMRVALAYANRIKYGSGESHLNETLSGGIIASMQFYVYSPSGVLVASSSGNYLAQDGNLKVVEFDPTTYGAGNYTIKVKMIVPTSDGRATNFDVAWR